MSDREVVLCARDLGKSWRLNRVGGLARSLTTRENVSAEFWALQGVDLELCRGEALGVVGENGAGKSTLLRLLCGTLRPTTGTVQVAGRIAALLELGAGFNPNFTGRENVWLNAAVLGLSRSEIADRFDAIAEFAGIGEFMDLPVRLYSSGMQARLAFAVSAHVNADILIVDEILAVGDAAFAQKCTTHLERFRKRGTLLFVSHNTGSVTRLCDRALWLDHGRVREIGPAGDVCAHYLADMAEGSSNKSGNANASGSGRWTLLDSPPVIRDPRQLLRNTIALSSFNREAPWHGHGGAQITDVCFCDALGTNLQEVSGGDEVTLRIVCRAERALSDPIVGFLIRDRLGQNVFGDSTYLACRDRPRPVEAGDAFVAEFRFQLPFLARGDYALTVAITEGTQEDHIHIHWIEEAVMLSVQASPVRHGIIGIPAVSIEIEKENAAEAA